MNKKISAYSRFIIFIISFVLIFTSFSFVSFGAGDSFEKSIASFPESYKPYLRKLHKDYPDWEFKMLDTKLDWYDSVEAQFADNKSLVTASTAYTDIFRSREIGDYNYDKGIYIQKDAGFVRGNKLAVSYFMDPRNFLTPEGIFQFERLSFDSSITVSDVESILDGSFMSDAYITYYGGKIEKITDEETNEVKYEYKLNEKKTTSKKKYAEVIYEAGKKYNVNPCFLAAKIINEVSKNGSSSVSGTQKNYPGVYNFYNVGAYDGSNPTETGLKWASTNGTYAPGSYGRPWITPEKSIIGGAQFNASSYINAGQYTGYLQRFNVDPNADNKPYTHQYMTNLSGAASPAYETYKSYRDNGLLKNKFTFIIPVYLNMPSENITKGTIEMADSRNQIAKANTGCNIRKGPSTDYALTGYTLESGTQVNIVETVFTDSTNTDNIMRYPYWCKIKFTKDGKSITGYVYSNFLTINTQTIVKKGSYSPLLFKSDASLDFDYISSDVNVAEITDTGNIKFKKNGTAVISGYNSVGLYQRVKYYVVSDNSKYIIDNVKLSDITQNSVKVKFTKNSYYQRYEIFIVNANGKLVKSAATNNNYHTFTGLDASSKYTVYVRAYKTTDLMKIYSTPSGKISFATSQSPNTPDKIETLDVSNTDYKSVIIEWSAVKNADGYCVYTFDSTNGKYTLLEDLSSDNLSYTDTSENVIKDTVYAVCAYRDVNGERFFGEYTTKNYISPKITLGKISGFITTGSGSQSVKLQWNKVKNADGYIVYVYKEDKGTYSAVAKTNKTSYTVKGLKSSSFYRFKVKPYITVLSKQYNGTASKILIAKTCPAAPAEATITNVTTTSYTIKWNSVYDAHGYRIYRYDAATGTYKKYKDTTSTSLKISSLKPGAIGKYKIRSYYTSNTTTYLSDSSVAFEFATNPPIVKNVSVSGITSNSAKLTWNKLSGVSEYRIYTYNTKTGKYTYVTRTTKTSVTLKNLKPSTSYKYAVRAAVYTDYSKTYGKYSEYCGFKTVK